MDQPTVTDESSSASTSIITIIIFVLVGIVIVALIVTCALHCKRKKRQLRIQRILSITNEFDETYLETTKQAKVDDM